MKSMKTAKGDFKKFRLGETKAAPPPQQDLIKTGFLPESEGFPMMIEPNLDDVDLIAWAAENRDFIDEKLFKHGALLFRGFDVGTVEEFESFASAIRPDLFGEYGDLPNEAEGEKVYKTTPYPADKTILFHNESSHWHRWPMKQWFFCITPPRERGETPIADCRRIYQKLDPDIRRLFEEKGLLYVRNFVEGLDVSWQDFFMTGDRDRVEEFCRRVGTELEWLEGGGLRTRQLCPAVVEHPYTGEKSFFNQVELHHVSFLEPEVRDSLCSLLGEENMPRNVHFGDGTPIADEIMQRIGELYWDCSVQFTWQRGDIAMLDNMLVAHARNPYAGERRIVVALGQMIEKKDILQAA